MNPDGSPTGRRRLDIEDDSAVETVEVSSANGVLYAQARSAADRATRFCSSAIQAANSAQAAADEARAAKHQALAALRRIEVNLARQGRQVQDNFVARASRSRSRSLERESDTEDEATEEHLEAQDGDTAAEATEADEATEEHLEAQDGDTAAEATEAAPAERLVRARLIQYKAQLIQLGNS